MLTHQNVNVNIVSFQEIENLVEEIKNHPNMVYDIRYSDDHRTVEFMKASYIHNAAPRKIVLTSHETPVKEIMRARAALGAKLWKFIAIIYESRMHEYSNDESSHSDDSNY